MRRILGAVLGITLAVWCVPASAADVTLRFGRLAKLKDKDGTDKDQVIVKFVKESGLTAALPSPLCPAASSIRLTTDLQEVVIPLDCAFWEAKGSGYAYKDASGSAGGVTKVNFYTKPTGGKMLIKIKGDNYGVDAIGGPIASLEVALDVDGESYCGRFAPPNSPFIKNVADQILIKGPTNACIQDPTPTGTVTNTPTVTETRTPTPTATITLTPSDTPTPTITPTATFTVPPGSTATMTPTIVPAVAFRIDSLAIRDPHLLAPVLSLCIDATDENPLGISANGSVQDLIELDDNMDGFLDLNLVALMRPLAQTPGSGGTLEIVTGQCTIPFGGETCSPDVGTPQSSTYTSQGSGTCMTPLPGTVGPDNTGSYSPALVTSAAPCFATTPVTLSFDFGLFAIPLQDVRASATYVGAPANQLIDGLLVGFLSETDANTILIPESIPLIGNRPLSVLLPGGDGNCATHTAKDTGPGGAPGWYFYLNFSAHEVPWTGE